MNLICPQCTSARILVRNRGKKIGSALGTVAGALGTAVSILRSSELQEATSDTLSTTGILLTTATGVILSGLMGGSTGAVVGAKLGEIVDNNVLNNYQCLSCGLRYSQPSSSPTQDQAYPGFD
ncbi:MAG: hypothetical protein Q8O85_09745 [Rhodoferax sp.]|uniref:hypothetical protein n=1 Tax=Rhodoferax sp. TaxID=50421 RepID=UPI00273298FF|nr:hypothetical protein [Rhodoferax sp.]MDP2678991.1 hypothetical protein [Rhodoferax sp.]